MMIVRILMTAGSIVYGLAVLAQTPCVWTSAPGQITQTCGNVGIGTAAPLNELHIKDSTGPATLRIEGSVESGVRIVGDRDWKLGSNIMNAGAGTFVLYDVTGAKSRMVVAPASGVGFGTSIPWGGIHIKGAGQVSPSPVTTSGLPAQNAATLFVQDSNATNGSGGMIALGASTGHFAVIKGSQTDPSGNSLGDLIVGTRSLATDATVTERMRVTAAGRVGIGLTAPATALDVAGSIHATGNISADGIINAKYQDLAEWVPATATLAPGTVVVLALSRVNTVTMSERAYDTAVAGVVSGQPGLLLGEKGMGREMIATTGRVRVMVDARRTPLAVGDLLVTSDTPGMAMRSEPLTLSGRRLHQPGTILGKALEPLARGHGEILVLLSLQ